MQQRFAVIILLIVFSIPVGAQGVDFLASLMRAVVEEFGIQQVIAVLEDLGYIGEEDVAVSESIAESASVGADELTVRSPIWDDPEGEETLVYMVESDDASCYSYIEWSQDTDETLAERMKWRQRFINKCLGR